MIITKLELLQHKVCSDGRCLAILRVIGEGGEQLQFHCKAKAKDRMILGSNAALAQDALRQIRCLPEYRRSKVSAAPNVLPSPRQRRRITLTG